MKTKITFIITMLASTLAFAQTAYRTVASGNWNAIATWERYNAGTWAAAGVGQLPGATDSVYIQTGHTVTLTQNESCGDLNLHNAASQQRIVLAGFTLSVNGKLGCFSAVTTGTFFPVTYNSSTSSFATWINTSVAGSAIRIVGNSRTVAVSGQWGANPAGWNVEFALNVGESVVISPNFKAGRIIVKSGNVTMSGDMRADGGSANTGDVYVESGATLILNANVVRTGTLPALVDTVNVSGTLVFGGSNASQNFQAGSLIVNNGGVIKKVNANSLLSTITNRTWANGSLLDYSGTANQTVGGEFPAGTSIPKVRINNTAVGGTVTFPASRTIRDTLVMNEGNIVIPSTDSLILGVTTTGVLQRTTGTIIGTLNRYISASTTGNVLFPVGTATTYRPVNADFIAAPVVAGNVSITHFDNGTGASAITSYSDGGYTVDRVSDSYWRGSILGGLTAANITLSCDLAGQTGIANASETRISGTPDGLVAHGAPGGNHSAGSGTTAYRTNFQLQSPLYFRLHLGGNSSTNPLSVTYKTITAAKTASGNVLSWSTASEKNNSHFNVERSLNNAEFEIIGTVKGNGNTSKTVKYSFTDHDAIKGAACYRLNQVDFDGKSNVSNTVCVANDKKQADVITTPNPFNDKLEISYAAANNSTVSVEVIDMLGKLHYSNTENVVDGNNNFSINTTSLPTGVYFVRVTNGTEVSTQRIIKK